MPRVHGGKWPADLSDLTDPLSGDRSFDELNRSILEHIDADAAADNTPCDLDYREAALTAAVALADADARLLSNGSWSNSSGKANFDAERVVADARTFEAYLRNG